METTAQEKSLSKKRKKKQTKKITEKKPKKNHTVAVDTIEPKMKPKRGRKRKVIVPIEVTTEKVDEIFITDEQPIYCKTPIEFGGMTVFTKIENPPSPPPLPSTTTSETVGSSKNPDSDVNKKDNKWQLVKLKNENNWKSKVEKKNLNSFNKKIEDTSIACWYCTHEFKGNAVSIPASFSVKRGYLCHGVFCGWGCAKTWNMESNSQMKFQRNDFISKFIRLSNGGAYISIPPAPNRYSLKKFGGDLDIDEFREKSLFFSNNDLFNGILTDKTGITFTTKTPCTEIEFE